VALPLVGCGQSEGRGEASPPPIEIKATVEPAQMMTITAQLDGQVQSMPVREGTKVTAGTILAQLFNAAVERDTEVARAQLDWIERRGRRDVPARPAVATPSSNLEAAARNVESKRQQLEKMRSLRRTRDITARELEWAEAEYAAAVAFYNSQQARPAGAPAPAVDLAALRNERQRATAEHRYATQRQSQLRITTPIPGTVTRLYVRPGQAVAPRDPIADVADASTLHVRGAVAPELLRYLKPGMKVDVRIMSAPPRTFADEIDHIIPARSGADARNPVVVVELPNPDGSLRPNTEAMIALR